MSIQVRNTTVSAIFIADIGFSVPASYTHTVPPQEYALWASSENITSHITDGSLVVVFEDRDLLFEDGIDIIRYQRSGWFDYSMQMIRDHITSGRTLFIPSGRQFLLADELIVEGEVEIEGTLGVL